MGPITPQTTTHLIWIWPGGAPDGPTIVVEMEPDRKKERKHGHQMRRSGLWVGPTPEVVARLLCFFSFYSWSIYLLFIVDIGCCYSYYFIIHMLLLSLLWVVLLSMIWFCYGNLRSVIPFWFIMHSIALHSSPIIISRTISIYPSFLHYYYYILSNEGIIILSHPHSCPPTYTLNRG